jgi:hypothetical protein
MSSTTISRALVAPDGVVSSFPAWVRLKRGVVVVAKPPVDVTNALFAGLAELTERQSARPSPLKSIGLVQVEP